MRLPQALVDRCDRVAEKMREKLGKASRTQAVCQAIQAGIDEVERYWGVKTTKRPAPRRLKQII